MTSWGYTVSVPDDPPSVLSQKTATQYALMMRDLLPPGILWFRNLSSVLMRTLLGAAEELARVSGRSLDLIEESDSRTATELLPDYERELELSSTGTDEERRNRITSKIIEQLGVRPVDYQQVLAPLLQVDPADVQVIERTTSDPVVIGEPREIYQYIIFRDPLLPGTPDIEAAQEQVTSMEHAHTRGTVIGTDNFLCDDPNSLCDRDLLGV